MFLLNGKPLPLDTPFTGADGTQYPSNWLRLSSVEDKARLGITEIADPVRADDRLYWNGDINNPKALEDKLEVKEDGSPLLDEQGNQVVTKGLKSYFISQVKQTAGSLLSSTDWMVIRNYERGIDIPSSVVAYRAGVVARSAELESAITAVQSVEELAALNLSFDLVQNP